MLHNVNLNIVNLNTLTLCLSICNRMAPPTPHQMYPFLEVESDDPLLPPDDELLTQYVFDWGFLNCAVYQNFHCVVLFSIWTIDVLYPCIMYSDYPWSILSDPIRLYHALRISKINIIEWNYFEYDSTLVLPCHSPRRGNDAPWLTAW